MFSLKNLRSATIAVRLLSAFLLIGLVPLAIVAVVAYTNSEQALREEIVHRLVTLADSRAREVETYSLERQRDVTTLSSTPEIVAAMEQFELAFHEGTGSPQYTAIDEQLRPFLTQYTQQTGYLDLFLIAPDGDVLFSTLEGDVLGTNFYDGSYSTTELAKAFDRAKTLLDTEISNFGTFPGIQEQTAFLAAPVFKEGRVIGVVALHIDNEQIYRVVNELSGLGETGEIIAATRIGEEILFVAPTRHDPQAAFTRSASLNDTQQLPLEDAVRGINGVGTAFDYRGQEVLAVREYLPSLRWGMVVKMDTVEAFAPVITLRNIVGVLAGFIIIVVAIVAIRIARSISLPLLKLTASAQQLSQGNFATPITVQSGDEIGQLADTFRSMAGELQGLVTSLETRVQARTADLSKTVEVGRLANSINSQQELLPRLVDYIRGNFDLYYTQIYLLDEAQQFAVLRAGTGEAGQALLGRKHRLNLGETSLVARAVQSGSSVVVSDTGADTTHKPNPLLPDTRSEVAIPLKIGNDILGVLDMQATRPGTFTNENAAVFEAMGGQIASAIRSAQSFDEAQAATARAEAVNQQLTSTTWQSYLGVLDDGARIGYEYDLEAPRPLSAEFDTLQAGDGANRSAHPITVRGAAIGNIVIKNDEGYNLTSDEQVLVEDTSKLMAQALERFRALDELRQSQAEITRRAAQMETVAQVSAASASILDVDQLLQTVSDLTKSNFDLYHAHVYLLDHTGENLVLTAGAGEAGRVMRANRFSIPFNRQDSLVATAARERRALISNDVTQVPNFLANPLLPDTRSEMALPMVVVDTVIGVLDVQANTVNRFTEEDVRVQVALANQIAVAVENARAYAEQQQMTERLREVDKLKSQFLANMSHELRTPLNSIIGYAEVLLDGIDGELNDEAQQDVDAIHSGGKHLLTIINDILDLAKIEAGQMIMDRVEINPMLVIDDVINTCDILARNKGLNLSVETHGDIPTVKGDAVRMKQIILNLVNNAIKFTEQGGVTVEVERYDQRQLVIRVRDTGMGMTDEDMGGLFQQFHQVDGSPTRRAGGTGLGLVIARHLAHLHDGEIDVESEKDAGTTFSFTLPLYARASQTMQAVKA